MIRNARERSRFADEKRISKLIFRSWCYRSEMEMA